MHLDYGVFVSLTTVCLCIGQVSSVEQQNIRFMWTQWLSCGLCF